MRWRLKGTQGGSAMRIQFLAVMALTLCAFFVLMGPPVFGHAGLAWIRDATAFGLVLAGLYVAGVLKKKVAFTTKNR
jgi:hypothetical protein